MADHAQAIPSGQHAPGTHPDLPPPLKEVGVYGWMYHNLFSTWWNTAMTLGGIVILWFIVPPFLDWMFLDAYWGSERTDCPAQAGRREGACWAYIGFWFKQLMYGRYPSEELWRINTAYVIGAASLLWLVMPRTPWKGWVGAFVLIPFPIACFFLFVGGTSLFAVPKWVAFFALVVAGMLAFNPQLRALSWMPAYRRFGFPFIALVLIAFIAFGDARPSVTFAAGPESGNVNVATDSIRVPGHGFDGGDRVHYSIEGGTVIGGLSTDETYHLIVVDESTVKLAETREDYEAGAAVDLTDQGGGAHNAIALAPPIQGVETPLWGGLFLTLVIAVTGIVASLPIGVVLALGRRSEMPIVKSLCVAFIELWRGVPLITVLFMSSVMFPLFMPEGVNFDKLIRALVGVMFFASAYMAEVVRGGLQAIPKGQYEAADSLGLSYWKSMAFVILPQALKIVIPGIVNTFIGLFKDTTLVLIIGLFDFLGSAQSVSTNPDWLGFAVEGYVFVGFGFWLFCFAMSRYSQHLERKLHTGH